MEIKPCPFCGSENLSVGSFGNYIKCKNCGTAGPDGSTLNEAFDKWNAAPRKEDVEMEKNCGNCKYNQDGYCSAVPPYKYFQVDSHLCCTDWETKEPEPAPLTPSNSRSLNDLCTAAVNKWGAAAQVQKAVEELSELTLALTRWLNRKDPSDEIIDNIHEEREDVEIMLRQLDVIFGRSEEWQHKKYEHLQAIVEDTVGRKVKRS